MRLNLSYLVTAHYGNGSDTRAEHELLSDVLAVFLRNPTAPAKYRAGDLAEDDGEVLPLSIAQPDHLALDDPAGLWSALGGRLRPTLGLLVIAPFDPFETKWVRVVREAVLGIGQGTPDRGGPLRPLDIRSVRVSVAGVVTTADGQHPLEGVRVGMVQPQPPGTNGAISEAIAPFVPGEPTWTVTDGQGFYAFMNLPAGPQRLRFEKRGYVTHEQSFIAPPLGRPDRLETLVIALSPLDDAASAAQHAAHQKAVRNDPRHGALIETERSQRVTLSGVLRYPDGRPAAYVPVQFGSRRTATDAEGFYCFFDLSDAEAGAGSHALVADVPGVGPVPLTSIEAARPVAERKGTAKRSDREDGRNGNGGTVASASSIVPLPGSRARRPE